MSGKAPGAPGRIPVWEHADKDGVGASYSPANHVWFTLWRGALTEVYYPTVDRAQIRHLLLVVSDGRSLVLHEGADLECRVTRLGGTSEAYRVTAKAPSGEFQFEKDVICDPDLPCVMQRYRMTPVFSSALRYYIVCNPHLEAQGHVADSHVIELNGRKFLTAHKDDHWVAVGSSGGFSRASVGFAGVNDGLTDLSENGQLDSVFTEADEGNVVLTGEIPERIDEFTIALAFGLTQHAALTAVTQSLASPFSVKLEKYLQQWQSAAADRLDIRSRTGDGGRVYDISCNTICTHEDRTYRGALIASLAIPWGEVKQAITPAHAGYHLVWTRDAVNCAGALLAAGDCDTPLRTLTYLAVSQQQDGSFAQNFWINGEPNWTGLQLDEVTYPILLARRLHREHALLEFNPLPMTWKAIEYIVHRGPITPQERWEQMSGYSPATIAIVIAATVCAAAFAREDGKPAAAQFLEDYADWMRDHIEAWTVTTAGELLPGSPRYIIRLTPASPGDAGPVSPNEALLKIPDQKPGRPNEFPARNIVSPGFLELVRYGVLDADDPLIVGSLRVVDAVLKIDTPAGPCWRRFNHDGYGQRDDGSPFDTWGKGRAWPLLTGERGHYALRAGQDPMPYIAAMEHLSGTTGLIAEQVWDRPFWKDGRNYFGRPTGSANPLTWAHAEYIKLVRSASDGRVFDLPHEVERRYSGKRGRLNKLAMWTFNYPIPTASAGETLRIYSGAPFVLRYSLDDWAHVQDVHATDTELSIHYVDVPLPPDQRASARFTFRWKEKGNWQGCDYAVVVTPGQ
ncbi:MAG TPA: glycoside hydrolase family 15 protein [Bryobacteraceae bacterium]|nr:glycoside hydrolase family 15 protein [Bryobacteraceae bacterium]